MGERNRLELEKGKTEYIEMRFGPKWPYVSTIRNFMQNFLGVAIGNQKLSDKVSMTISELVENAVRYSDNTETFLKVSIHRENDRIEISVKNHASSNQAEGLLQFMKELESDPPLEAYVKRMKQSTNLDRSQLGLARIRYEAGAQLRADCNDLVVTMNAWFEI